jgi:hypothetical protein
LAGAFVPLNVNADEPASESRTERPAKETQNPVANLISVPWHNNFNFGIGPDLVSMPVKYSWFPRLDFDWQRSPFLIRHAVSNAGFVDVG